VSDTETQDDAKLVPVSQATAIVQAGIRAADAHERQRLWIAWTQDFLPEARAANPHIMPWDNVDDVRLAPLGALKRAIASTLNLVSDDDERMRVIRAAADAADKIGTTPAALPGR
jgi:hypothetical protein